MHISAPRISQRPNPSALKFRAEVPPTEEWIARYPEVQKVAQEFATALRPKIPDLEKFRVKSDPRFTQLISLEVIPWTYQLKEPLIMVEVDNHPEPLAEILRILREMAGDGVTEKAGTIEMTVPGQGPVVTQFEFKGVKIQVRNDSEFV